jgi:hypothetical protein
MPHIGKLVLFEENAEHTKRTTNTNNKSKWVAIAEGIAAIILTKTRSMLCDRSWKLFEQN